MNAEPQWIEPDGTRHWETDLNEGLDMLLEKGCGAWVGDFGGCNQAAANLAITPAFVAFFLFRTAQFGGQPLWAAFLCERHARNVTIDMPRARRRERARELAKYQEMTEWSP